MAITNAVVAICVVLVPKVAVGANGTPVRLGEASGAFKFNAVCVAVEIGLFKSVVLFTNSKAKFVLAANTVAAPVPPFAIATIPVTFKAVPLALPVKLAVIVLAEKFPVASLATIALFVFASVAVVAELETFKAVAMVAKFASVIPAVPDKLLFVKPEIVFDDFAKIDLRVGTIVAASKVEKADKLLQLSVDLGFETRTIVSGIAQHFEPASIVGKQVTVVVNLAPRKMRGIESNGMILMAEDANGKLHFINPSDNINPGSGVS